jgi:hypothetical protein
MFLRQSINDNLPSETKMCAFLVYNHIITSGVEMYLIKQNIKQTCDIHNTGLTDIVSVDIVQHLNAYTNTLKWRQHQHLTDPWPNLVRIRIVFVHCCVASNSIACVPIQTVFFISAETSQLLQQTGLPTI